MEQLALKKIYAGKVRELYEIDEKRMLMVASDRLSAFDVILDDSVPQKGEILTQISQFWFDRLQHIMPNHLTGDQVRDILPLEQAQLMEKRAVVVKKLQPVKVEAIVRGYLAGSGWKEYQETGSVCDVPLPAGLQEASKLPEVIFTPSSKAEVGDHDENISFATCVSLLGQDLADQVRRKSIELYLAAVEYAKSRGIIIADTKFEFGLDDDGVLTLMDEVLTPDSSRFWSANDYQVGMSPPSFDKQFVRDWLLSSGWDKKSPAPRLPAEVIQKTQNKYHEAWKLLTSQ